MDPNSCSMVLYHEDLLHARGGQEWCKMKFELRVMQLAPTVGAKWAIAGKLDHLPSCRALRSTCRVSGGRLPRAQPESGYWPLAVWRGLATVQLQNGLVLQQIWKV